MPKVVRRERWLDIPGTEGKYSASSLGRIRSNRSYHGKPAGAIRKLTPGNHGYLTVSLWQDGRKTTRLVHALIAETFIGPCPVGQEVRHDDGAKHNCSAQNLLYGTRRDNEKDKVAHGRSNRGERCGNAVLDASKVVAIRRKLAIGFSYGELANEYGTGRSTIQHIDQRTTWRHI